MEVPNFVILFGSYLGPGTIHWARFRSTCLKKSFFSCGANFKHESPVFAEIWRNDTIWLLLKWAYLAHFSALQYLTTISVCLVSMENESNDTKILVFKLTIIFTSKFKTKYINCSEALFWPYIFGTLKKHVHI